MAILLRHWACSFVPVRHMFTARRAIMLQRQGSNVSRTHWSDRSKLVEGYPNRDRRHSGRARMGLLQDTNANVTLDLGNDSDIDFQSETDMDLERTSHIFDVILGETLWDVVFRGTSSTRSSILVPVSKMSATVQTRRFEGL